jgi:plasmid segregation protein ParM
MRKLGIDIGYSSCKIAWDGELYKLPTAISFAHDIQIEDNDNNLGADVSYDFEGDMYYVGKAGTSDESFTTTDFDFLYKFAPLLVYHIIKLLEITDVSDIELRAGLAIVDWGKKETFETRMNEITVNDTTLDINMILVPQGSGAALSYVTEDLVGEWPGSLFVLDIGYNTINVLYFEDGAPIKHRAKSFPGHGVSSIIRPFTAYLENKFSLPFSEHEASDIFRKGTFIFQGSPVEDVVEEIINMKKQFVTKLTKSILISEKKTLSTSEVVLFTGGGAYYLDDIGFPPNVKFPQKPYEHSNVKGYVIP